MFQKVLIVLLSLYTLGLPAVGAQEADPDEIWQTPGAHTICQTEIPRLDGMGVQIQYIAGEHDTAFIYVEGPNSADSSPTFKRTTIQSVECSQIPDDGSVIFEIYITRSADLDRGIDIGGFSLNNITDLLSSGDQLKELFAQFAQNVIDLADAQDITCLGVASYNIDGGVNIGC